MTNKFQIKGTAITPGVSRNGVFYSKQELRKFSTTLSGRPILMDHSNKVRSAIGRVEKSWWSSAKQAVRYKGWIKNSEIEEKIKDRIIQNVSIGAVHKKLVEEKDEVTGEMYVKVEDMTGVELSLIPVPGIPTATVTQALEEDLDFDVDEFVKDQMEQELEEEMDEKESEDKEGSEDGKTQKADGESAEKILTPTHTHTEDKTKEEVLINDKKIKKVNIKRKYNIHIKQ